jgi:pyruvate/2-oxoacid:ferredoxin oxidoreductase alpha subunit
LPSFQPKIEVDTANPSNMSQMSPPAVYMEMRHAIQATMEAVEDIFEEAENSFFSVFERKYGIIEAIDCDDADIIILASGTAVGTCRQVVSNLREKGQKAGLLKIKMFRPFPARAVRAALKKAQKVAVIDRNCSFGAGGIFAQETKAALCNMDQRPLIFSYIAGLGGRDITPGTVEEIYYQTKEKKMPEQESVWIGLEKG